jgi:hypothetical protein
MMRSHIFADPEDPPEGTVIDNKGEPVPPGDPNPAPSTG